jgi:hypothetical protein
MSETTGIERVRAEFEADWSERHDLSASAFERRPDGGYLHAKVQASWEMWRDIYSRGMERAADICLKPMRTDSDNMAERMLRSAIDETTKRCAKDIRNEIEGLKP